MASGMSGGPGIGPGGGGNANAALVKNIIAKLTESARKAAAQQRPWTEMVDRSSFAKPDNLSDALSRIRKNLGYFRANYLAVLLGVVVLSMLYNPVSIIVLALLGSGWAYLFVIRVEPLVISGRVISDREKLVGMAAISILIVFGITSVGSILISGVIVGFAAICIHGAFRVPDDLFLDDNDNASFLSFFSLGPTGPTLPTQMPMASNI